MKLLEDAQSFEVWKSGLIKNGKLNPYRVMNLKQNPVEMIKAGHSHLGLCWSYDLNFLRHGDYDFGYGGEPENWFYFGAIVDESSVDWESTEELYTDLNDFEKEVRLLPNQPLKLIGITDHWGRPLDCSPIKGVKLDTGNQKYLN